MPDLTWRMATWTERHRRPAGHLRPLPGQRAGRRRGLAAATRAPAAGSRCSPTAPRWSGSTGAGSPPTSARAALRALHREVDCWRNLWRLTDPIGGPVRLHRRRTAAEVDRGPLQGPARLRPYAPNTRCPRRSWATPTTRPTRPSPRSATALLARLGRGRRAAARGLPRRAATSPAAGRLRAVRAGPPGRAGSGRRCSGRSSWATRPACRSTIASNVWRAVRPLPNAGPLGSAVKYFSSASRGALAEPVLVLLGLLLHDPQQLLGRVVAEGDGP